MSHTNGPAQSCLAIFQTAWLFATHLRTCQLHLSHPERSCIKRPHVFDALWGTSSFELVVLQLKPLSSSWHRPHEQKETKRNQEMDEASMESIHQPAHLSKVARAWHRWTLVVGRFERRRAPSSLCSPDPRKSLFQRCRKRFLQSSSTTLFQPKTKLQLRNLSTLTACSSCTRNTSTLGLLL